VLSLAKLLLSIIASSPDKWFSVDDMMSRTGVKKRRPDRKLVGRTLLRYSGHPFMLRRRTNVHGQVEYQAVDPTFIQGYVQGDNHLDWTTLADLTPHPSSTPLPPGTKTHREITVLQLSNLEVTSLKQVCKLEPRANSSPCYRLARGWSSIIVYTPSNKAQITLGAGWERDLGPVLGSELVALLKVRANYRAIEGVNSEVQWNRGLAVPLEEYNKVEIPHKDGSKSFVRMARSQFRNGEVDIHGPATGEADVQRYLFLAKPENDIMFKMAMLSGQDRIIKALDDLPDKMVEKLKHVLADALIEALEKVVKQEQYTPPLDKDDPSVA
jgi:hypothetical protein